MEPAASNNKKKIIAVLVVLVAITLLTIGAKALGSKNDSSQNTPSTSDTSTSTGSTPNDTSSSNPSSSASYKDGTYTATGNYQSPGGPQSIDVSITLHNGVVTDSAVQAEASGEARGYQDDFVGGYKTFVTGKSIDGIRLSRVSGSSLTSGGFNSALEQIKQQAKA